MRVAGFMLSSNSFSLLKIKLLNIHNGLFADFANSAPFMVLNRKPVDFGLPEAFGVPHLKIKRMEPSELSVNRELVFCRRSANGWIHHSGNDDLPAGLAVASSCFAYLKFAAPTDDSAVNFDMSLGDDGGMISFAHDGG